MVALSGFGGHDPETTMCSGPFILQLPGIEEGPGKTFFEVFSSSWLTQEVEVNNFNRLQAH